MWERIEEKAYATKKKRYVVCVDTIGQDREMLESERRLVLETVKKFRGIWEEKERESLRRDRERRIAQLEDEKDHIDSGDNVKLADEEEKFVEDGSSSVDQDQFPDDESKDLFAKNLKIKFLAKLLAENDEWKKSLLSLKDTTVIKMPRILQSVFYLLQFKREDVCQPNSNKFFWKFAKKHLSEAFLERLVAYSPLGLKIEPRTQYSTLNFIEKNLEGITPEDVDSQCGLTIGKLFRWLLLCLKTRKEDIIYRKSMRKRAI